MILQWQRRGRRGTLLPAIGIPIRDDTPKGEMEFRPHSLWLTRERTDNEPPTQRHHRSNRISMIKKKEEPQRRAYVQLGVLHQGDIFVSILLSCIC